MRTHRFRHFFARNRIFGILFTHIAIDNIVVSFLLLNGLVQKVQKSVFTVHSVSVGQNEIVFMGKNRKFTIFCSTVPSTKL